MRDEEAAISVLVERGDVLIEEISGKVSDRAFLLHISTLEKYVEPISIEGHVLLLFCGERTRRYGELTGKGGDPTRLSFPPGWQISAEEGRYTVRAIGVRVDDLEVRRVEPS